MRPTDLHFKSPKDKTGEFIIPSMTKEGIVTDFSKKALSD